MIQLDFHQTLAISACSALAGGALLMCEQVPDAHMRRVVRTWGLGLFVVGFSLACFSWAGARQPPWADYVGLAGTAVAIPIFTLSTGALLRVRWATPASMAAVIVFILIAQGVACLQGGSASGVAHVLLNFAVNLMLCVAGWDFIVRPRSMAERFTGMCAVIYTCSWAVRCHYALGWEGPPLANHFYVPDFLSTPICLLYGTLPATLAAILLNLQNEHLERQLKVLASLDELTGTLVRREIRARGQQMLQRRRTGDQTLAVMMIDIDAFKTINDDHGHPTGDAVLRRIADTLRTQLRADALLGRYGGEEFLLMVPVESTGVAHAIAERLREAVAQADCPLAPGHAVSVTVSIGVALVGDSEAFDQAVARADEALYRAKRAGRDRVELSPATA